MTQMTQRSFFRAAACPERAKRVEGMTQMTQITLNADWREPVEETTATPITLILDWHR